MKFAYSAVVLLLCAPASVSAESPQKLSEDPTKVITKLGVRYSDFATLSGSVAFGPVTKVNASITENKEWSLGGSYLFGFGIVNVAASRKELSSGIRQTQYSIGSFVPLGAFGIQPAGWQIFPAFGVNYTDGQLADIDLNLDDSLLASTSSKGGYIGALVLKSLSDNWIFKTGFVGSRGSNNYSGYSIGAGLTYALTDRDSLGIFGSYIDNSYGQRDQFGVSYKREF
ncbi:hypothetical protein FAP39_07315 [Shimia litoralis]|uniref:Porin family protein n=1 Tax=Shimia litoralis TaxID=420403 RepID=A0A4U7N5U1_9RHOB|nr:hypothetical protein [Shimia litoralis]TKZ21219.1 hypothetical protein FAP39_07315 [Shimia litoralis]